MSGTEIGLKRGRDCAGVPMSCPTCAEWFRESSHPDAPVTLQPCSHSLCGPCGNAIVLAGSSCPVCDAAVSTLAPNLGLGDAAAAEATVLTNVPPRSSEAKEDTADTTPYVSATQALAVERARACAHATSCMAGAKEAEDRIPAATSAIASLDASRDAALLAASHEIAALKTLLDRSHEEYVRCVREQHRERLKALECRRDDLVVSANQLRTCGLWCTRVAEGDLVEPITRACECALMVEGLIPRLAGTTGAAAVSSCVVDIVPAWNTVAPLLLTTKPCPVEEHRASEARAKMEATVRDDAITNAILACGRFLGVSEGHGDFGATMAGCFPFLHLPHVMRACLAAFESSRGWRSFQCDDTGYAILKELVLALQRMLQNSGGHVDPLIGGLWCCAVSTLGADFIQTGPLATFRERLRLFRTTGGIDVLQSLMELCPDSEVVQYRGLKLLRGVVLDEPREPVNRFVKTIFGAMDSRVQSGSVQAVACSILEKLLPPAGAWGEYSCADVVGRVVAAMCAHPLSSPIRISGLHVLADMTINVEASRLVMAELPRLLVAVDAELSSVNAVAYSCTLLRNLAHMGENCAPMVALGVVPRVFAAMDTYRDSAVLSPACGVFINLLSYLEHEQTTLAPVAHGMLERAVSVMKLCMANFRVVETACLAFHNLTRRPDMRQAFLTTGALEVLITAMATHLSSVVVQKSACYVLGNLALAHDLNSLVVTPVSLQRIALALDTFPEKETLLAAAERALLIIATKPENQLVMVETGCAERLERLQTRPRQPPIA